MSTQLQGKVALITGANQGIGLAIATALGKQGCELILLNRTTGKLQQLENQVPNVKFHEEQVDIGDGKRVVEIITNLRQKYPRIDILVNNAGVALQGGHNFWDQDPANFHQVLSTNINGTVNVTHAVLKNFFVPQRRGTVLNISSTTAQEPPPPGYGEVIYHSTKTFMEGFTNALRMEVVDTNIRVLALRPGIVLSNFHYQRMNRDDEAFKGVYEGMEEVRVEDIAEAAVWMLQAPERISVKALDLVPTAQRGLGAIDRNWNERQKELDGDQS